MSRPDRLRSLEQLAGFNETQASRQLAERLRGLAKEEDRLRQLEDYAREYAGRGPGPATSVATLQAGRRFLERLQAAVRQQLGVVQRARQQVDQATADWRAARARRLALAKLRERAAAAAAERRDRRDQRRLDELRSTAPGPGAGGPAEV